MRKTSNSPPVEELSRIAWELRLEALRMIYNAGSGHPGGTLSIAEILTGIYFYKARVDGKNPGWEERDRIILSKGHCAPIYYAALARAGFLRHEELSTFLLPGSRLQAHPDRNKVPGVEMSSGPLGLGASVAVGCALGLRLKGSQARVFCLLGDGEIQEGIVWEAALCGSKYELDNLIFVVDYNRYQLSGAVAEVMPLEPLSLKWESFGWRVFSVDGHDMRQVTEALDAATGPMKTHNQTTEGPCQPKLILARTVKGKGVSFMEGTSAWHGRTPSLEEMLVAEAEIKGQIERLQRKGEGNGD